MTSIVFTGDIAFSGKFSNIIVEESIESKAIQYLKEADYVVANVESPITNRSISSGRELNHTSKPMIASQLLKLNANIWNLGNNHIWDCLDDGLEDTLKMANALGCKTLGVGKNIGEAVTPIFLDNGNIAVFSIVQPFNHIKESGRLLTWEDRKLLKDKIAEIRAYVKWIIIVSHGGDEFSDLPLPWVRKLYRQFIDWGADVVVGHHPHVVQNYEIIDDKMIFYSLGNFIFDTDYQRLFRNTEKGILLKLSFGDENFEWDYMAIQIDREKQKIRVADRSRIFCNIDSLNYRLLWPTAAIQFRKNEDLKKRSTRIKFSKMTNLQWHLYKIKSYRHKREFILLVFGLVGKLRMGKWSKHRDVFNYIIGKPKG